LCEHLLPAICASLKAPNLGAALLVNNPWAIQPSQSFLHYEAIHFNQIHAGEEKLWTSAAD
jgi:hypothetical protein